MTLNRPLRAGFLLAFEACLAVLARWLVYGATGTCILLTGFVILSSFMRYLVGAPFHYTEELVALLFLVTVFMTVPNVSAQHGQIRVTLFTEMLPPGVRHSARLFGHLVTLAFTTWLGWEAYVFTADAVANGTRSEQAELPIAPWIGLATVCVFLVALITAIQLCLAIARGEPVQRGEPTGPLE